jgi:hypothetical protein
MKTCKRCIQTKDLSEFFKNVKRKDGVSTYCKPCQLEYQRVRYNNPESHERNKMDRNIYLKNRKDSTRKWYLKTTYGLSPDQYQNLYNDSDGKCYICKEEKDYYLHVDHNHKTGEVRGLLCNHCNRGIGMLKENIDILESAIEYIRKYNHGK